MLVCLRDAAVERAAGILASAAAARPGTRRGVGGAGAAALPSAGLLAQATCLPCHVPSPAWPTSAAPHAPPSLRLPADGMPQTDLSHTLPGPAYRNSRHFMISNTHVRGGWLRGINVQRPMVCSRAEAGGGVEARCAWSCHPCPTTTRRPPQEQWRRNQESNKRKGRPQVPLGTLVRPWATQRLQDLRDYRPQDWRPGSSDYVKRRASRQC